MQSIKSLHFRGQSPQRLDLFLTETYSPEGYIRSYWRHMIDADLVLVNGKSVKAGIKLKHGDTISIRWPTIDTSFRDKVRIIYENDDVLVMDKPAGMLVHSKGSFNPEFTVADYIAEKIDIKEDGQAANRRAGIVHRLDRHTSGVMITGRNKNAVLYLQRQFAERRVEKQYLAVVEGRLAQDKLRIDMPIQRDPANPKQMAVSPHGKVAITHVRVKSFDAEQNVSCVVLSPETGRTHQLRVHLAEIGHPIVGDTHYGANHALAHDRFLLHAHSLKIQLPNRDSPQEFIATMPDDMSSYWHDEDDTTDS